MWDFTFLRALNDYLNTAYQIQMAFTILVLAAILVFVFPIPGAILLVIAVIREFAKAEFWLREYEAGGHRPDDLRNYRSCVSSTFLLLLLPFAAYCTAVHFITHNPELMCGDYSQNVIPYGLASLVQKIYHPHC